MLAAFSLYGENGIISLISFPILRLPPLQAIMLVQEGEFTQLEDPVDFFQLFEFQWRQCLRGWSAKTIHSINFLNLRALAYCSREEFQRFNNGSRPDFLAITVKNISMSDRGRGPGCNANKYEAHRFWYPSLRQDPQFQSMRLPPRRRRVALHRHTSLVQRRR